MQKVITITSLTNIIPDGKRFYENQYPELQKLLDEGYRIIETIPVIKPADTSTRYAITFILEKHKASNA
jgi:hypothetical protein